jgi:hypothetical protein
VARIRESSLPPQAASGTAINAATVTDIRVPNATK